MFTVYREKIIKRGKCDYQMIPYVKKKKNKFS